MDVKTKFRIKIMNSSELIKSITIPEFEEKYLIK